MRALFPTIILLFFCSSILSQTPFVFQSSLESLPANFSGDSLISVAQSANALREKTSIKLPQKDEFETTDQFAKRLEEFKKRQAAGIVSDRLVLVFNSQLAVYDADSQTLDLRTTFTHLDESSIAFIKSDTTASSYIATNAFGARVNVTRTINSSYWIRLLGESFREPVVAQIKLDIPSAKAIKPNLRTIVYLKLVEPYSDVQRTSTSATFTSPSEIISSKVWYFAKPLEIWFFDQVTGKIISKKKM